MENGFKGLLDWEWYGNTNMVRIYLHLILKANTTETAWQDITVKRGCLVTSIAELSAETGLTIKQVRWAIKKLIEGKKIGSERARKKTMLTVYDFDSYDTSKIDPGQRKGTNNGNERAITKDEKEELPPAPLLEEKGEKEKNKKKILSKDNIKEKQKEESFVSPEFAQVFRLWLEYKRQRKESYKSEMSRKVCYNKLVKLSCNNPDIAVAIVEQSIANNWAGLFELKQNNSIHFNNGQQTYTNPVERRQYERTSRLQALASRLAASQTEVGETAESIF